MGRHPVCPTPSERLSISRTGASVWPWSPIHGRLPSRRRDRLHLGWELGARPRRGDGADRRPGRHAPCHRLGAGRGDTAALADHQPRSPRRRLPAGPRARAPLRHRSAGRVEWTQGRRQSARVPPVRRGPVPHREGPWPGAARPARYQLALWACPAGHVPAADRVVLRQRQARDAGSAHQAPACGMAGS